MDRQILLELDKANGRHLEQEAMSEKSDHYIELDETYSAHNYHPLDVVVERAEGVWVYDVDGNKYLDCLSAYSAVNQGHCHPTILAAAQEQMHRVTLTSRAFRNDQMGRHQGPFATTRWGRF
jgi:ornithine--oxo-acid transaminase